MAIARRRRGRQSEHNPAVAGASVEQALNLALAEDRFREYRQVAAIDANGDTAVFSGEFTLGIGGALAGDNCVAAGNMLAGQGVIAAMVRPPPESWPAGCWPGCAPGSSPGARPGRSTRRR